MKVRIKRRLRIPLSSPYGVPNINELKRSVSLVDIVAFNLEQDAEWVDDNKAMFHCWRPENHTNGDETASLWCYVDYHDSGAGRWGCPSCFPGGDDVFGFLQQFHNYTMAEALRYVQVWRMNHRLRSRK